MLYKTLQNFRYTILPNLFLSITAAYIYFLQSALNTYLQPGLVESGFINKQDVLIDIYYPLEMIIILNTLAFIVISVLAARNSKKISSFAYQKSLIVASSVIFITQVMPVMAGLVLYWNEIPGSGNLTNYINGVAAILLFGGLVIGIGAAWLVLKISNNKKAPAKHKA